MKNDVTFATNCYQGDYHAIIFEGSLEQKIIGANYNFKNRTLVINNVENKELVFNGAQSLKKQNIIDDFYLSEDFHSEVLNFFDISMDSFNGGYWYSIGPLTALYFCKTKYIVYLTGDSIIEKNNYNWIDQGIQILESNEEIKVINPVWNLQYSSALSNQNNYPPPKKREWENDWFWGMGFSDQCFLVEASYFKKKIYNEINNASDIEYPQHAGDSFEKRVSSHLKNKNLYRLTSKKISYYNPRWYY